MQLTTLKILAHWIFLYTRNPPGGGASASAGRGRIGRTVAVAVAQVPGALTLAARLVLVGSRHTPHETKEHFYCSPVTSTSTLISISGIEHVTVPILRISSSPVFFSVSTINRRRRVLENKSISENKIFDRNFPGEYHFFLKLSYALQNSSSVKKKLF